MVDYVISAEGFNTSEVSANSCYTCTNIDTNRMFRQKAKVVQENVLWICECFYLVSIPMDSLKISDRRRLTFGFFSFIVTGSH